MIIAAVEVQIVLVSEVRNVDRIAAGFMLIGRMRIEDCVDLPPQNVIRLRKSALHLVVDNTVDCNLTVGAVCLVMPALLTENILFFVNIWIKNRIQVDMHEVFEILLIAACDRIDCLVRIGHSVEEGVERTLGELDERILDREVPGAAEHCVFNDMRDTGGVLRRRAEGNVKDLVIVIFRKQCHARTCLFVPEQPAVAVHIRQELMRDHFVCRKVFNTGLSVKSFFFIMGKFHMNDPSPYLTYLNLPNLLEMKYGTIRTVPYVPVSWTRPLYPNESRKNHGAVRTVLSIPYPCPADSEK